MKISAFKVREYLYYFFIMILLSMSGVGHVFNAVHTGFFVALVFAGESVTILSVMYMLAGLIVTPTIENFIIVLVPAVVMTLTRIMLSHLHHRMTLLITCIATIISLVPVMVYTALYHELLVYGIMTIILTAIFTYISIVGVFAVVVKKLRYRLTTDEALSLLVILVVMSSGLYAVDIYGFKIYYTVMILLVLVLTSIFELMPCALIMVAYGIGGGINDANLELAGIILLMTLSSALFMRYNRYYSLISVLAFDLIGGAYFHAYAIYDDFHIIAILIGTIMFLLIPTHNLTILRDTYGRSNRRRAEVGFVERNRLDVTARITNLALLFKDIEAEMTDRQYIMTEKGAEKYLSQRIMTKTCLGCSERDTCFRALGGDTSREIAPIVSKAMLSKATKDDVSTFLQSRCNRSAEIVTLANEYVSRYRQMSIHICDVLDNKRILGEQIGSVGDVLRDFRDSLLDGVNMDSDREQQIAEELNMYGVMCNDVLVVEKHSGDMEISLVVRDRDKDKRIIRETLERLTRLKLMRNEDRTSKMEGFSTIRFVPKPQYRLTYGIGCTTKDGSEASGDSRSIVRLDASHVAVVLVDGKGSGAHAEQNSNNTISIIEKMYKAGFHSDVILSFANNVLSIRNGEDFTALDMCIINLQTAQVDFIKLGGVTSFIKRSSAVDTVEGSALPLGVLEEAVPSVESRALVEGDMLLLVSDGVTDGMGESELRQYLQEVNSANVQKVADEVVMRSSSHGAFDDVTVIAMKLVKTR